MLQGHLNVLDKVKISTNTIVPAAMLESLSQWEKPRDAIPGVSQNLSQSNKVQPWIACCRIIERCS